jgi:hypothetical protein
MSGTIFGGPTGAGSGWQPTHTQQFASYVANPVHGSTIFSRSYRAPQGATFAGQLAQPMQSTSHNEQNYLGRTRQRAYNITTSSYPMAFRTPTEQQTAAYAHSGYQGFGKAFSNSGIMKSFYHRADLCRGGFAQLAGALQSYFNNGEITKAQEQVNDCLQARTNKAVQKGSIDTSHEDVLKLMQNLYTVISEIGTELTGATIRYSNPGNHTFTISKRFQVSQGTFQTHYMFITKDGIQEQQHGGGKQKKQTRKSRKARNTRKNSRK